MTGYEYALYLTIGSKLPAFFTGLGWIAGFLAAVGVVLMLIGRSEEIPSLFKLGRTAVMWLVPVCAISSLLYTLSPTREDILLILGGGVAYEIVTSDQAKEIGELSLEFVKRKLKEDEVAQ